MAETANTISERRAALAAWADRQSGRLFILPAVITILALSIFPLIISLYLSLTRFKFSPDGYQLKYIGWLNYKKLLFGSEQYHTLGTFSPLTPFNGALLLFCAAALLYWLYRFVRSVRFNWIGLIGRLITAFTLGLISVIGVLVLSGKGAPGTLLVTLFYVIAGCTAQFLIGLGLALLCAQQIRGRGFFRLVFFIPLMVTPVGIAYAFRMLADMSKGPFAPLWLGLGLGQFSWAADAWSARLVVMIGDSWQWIPFIFLVMLAALENQPRDQVEAAEVDGASAWQIFHHVTWPAVLPVAATVILIRVIEAFKIIDLPNVLTNGGPGIATESMTLQAFLAWRSLNLGGSAATAYLLLFVTVVLCVSFFNLVVLRNREKYR